MTTSPTSSRLLKDAGTATLLKVVSAFRGKKHTVLKQSRIPIRRDNADQSSLEDLSYTLINHSVLGRRSSGISGAYYENISPNTKRPREFLRRTETSYALLHVPSSPRHLPSPEDEYELLTPGKISFHSLRQPHPPMLPSEIRVSCLKRNRPELV
ncbi:germinal center-associated signaling and motility protein isoform X4 [Acinonyx jubatus]|uniref:Germinal center-associated signaling and motility protein isoform X4 n=1 Tax=Acinonyx jubatus TaxID=32536 RepID=A0ABM3PYQ4_ACIJB|nr:germinal center-associated signaling and motility protein isoform X4 [Acinonyx jubatus]